MKNCRNDDNRSGIDDTAMTAGLTVLIIGASVASGVIGSWLPMLGTMGALFMLGEFCRWRNSRKK